MKTIFSKNFYILGLFLLFGLAGALFYYSDLNLAFSSLNIFRNSEGGSVIELREDGFYPSELTIQKGETVIFKTRLNKEFWPASDIHPTHGIYPEFDPKEPMAPDNEWSFTFTRVGRWVYHDHLGAYNTGVIYVLDEDGKKASLDCEDPEKSGPQCWKELIVYALEREGVGRAFEVLAGLYDKEPSFAAGCHGYVHLIGEETYYLFSEGRDVDINPKTSIEL